MISTTPAHVTPVSPCKSCAVYLCFSLPNIFTCTNLDNESKIGGNDKNEFCTPRQLRGEARNIVKDLHIAQNSSGLRGAAEPMQEECKTYKTYSNLVFWQIHSIFTASGN